MAKTEETKNRYRKGGPARLDMRKGGRVSKQAGGGAGNINIPDVDVQLTPEQLEAIRLANEAKTTTPPPAAPPPAAPPPPAPAPTPSAPASRRPPNPREGHSYTDENGVSWI